MAKPEKYLIYTAQRLSAVATHRNDVLVEILMPEAGLMPGVTIAVRMEPNEARDIALLLVQAAADTEK